jgi:integrase
MAWCGLRWGEMAGLRIGNVAFLRRRLSVVGVNTQNGRWKEYPKSSKSRREISVPPHVLEMLAPLVAGRAGQRSGVPHGAPGDRPWSGANWRVVWRGRSTKAGRGIDVPRYTPHALRHTAASTLVQDGVPLYDVQRLLGHESPQITARYAHLAPDAHGTVEAAWSRSRRTRRARSRRSGTVTPSLTCGSVRLMWSR